MAWSIAPQRAIEIAQGNSAITARCASKFKRRGIADHENDDIFKSAFGPMTPTQMRVVIEGVTRKVSERDIDGS